MGEIVLTGHVGNAHNRLEPGNTVANQVSFSGGHAGDTLTLLGIRVRVGVKSSGAPASFPIKVSLYNDARSRLVSGSETVTFIPDSYYDIYFSTPYVVTKNTTYWIGAYSQYCNFKHLHKDVNPTHTDSTADVNFVQYYLNWLGSLTFSWVAADTSLNFISSLYEFTFHPIVETPNNAPNIPTNVEKISPNIDTTPVFGATVTDPDRDKVKARFRVEQGSTFIGEIESDFVNNGEQATAEFLSTLNVGNYTLKASAVDINGIASNYSSSVSFKITSKITKLFIFKWDVAGSVRKELILKWHVAKNNIINFIFKWDIRSKVSINFIFKWDQETPWENVPLDETTSWEEV